jgi:hypothetical protein
VALDTTNKTATETCLHTNFMEFEMLNLEKPVLQHTLPSNKRHFLVDILGIIAEATIDIVQHYSQHGIANDLSTGPVLDCIEKTITVDFVTESDNDISED